MQEYADPVIDWLDAGRGILDHRLFRDVSLILLDTRVSSHCLFSHVHNYRMVHTLKTSPLSNLILRVFVSLTTHQSATELMKVRTMQFSMCKRF